jgi:hypothetical protein
MKTLFMEFVQECGSKLGGGGTYQTFGTSMFSFPPKLGMTLSVFEESLLRG